MINNKRELQFYLMADRIINGLSPNKSIKSMIFYVLMGGGIMSYLESMRKYSYYKRCPGIGNRIKRFYWGNRFRKYGYKLGFSIGEDVFGYGLIIPHYGTIVVGPTNKIGNYAVLHTSTCISAKESEIGDGLYLSTGTKITQKVILGNAVMIGANSVVNKSFSGNCLIAGAPAKEIRHNNIWFEEEPLYLNRVNQIEKLKIEWLSQ